MQILFISNILSINKLPKICSYILFVVLISFNPAQAQVQTITIGIDGLTCPLCSRGVEMALRKLKFIEKIEMDLDKTIAVISVKPNEPVSLNAIHKKVDESGFTLRFCNVQLINEEGVQIEEKCVQTASIVFELTEKIKINSGDELNLKLTAPKFNNIKASKEVQQAKNENQTTCTFSAVKEFFHVKVL